MSMRFVQGDYVPDGLGGFVTLNSREELLQRVLFLLTARRGGFVLLPKLGSRLYLLPRAKASARTALAGKYVAEALAGETEFTLTGVDWQEETGKLTVYLNWKGDSVPLALSVGRG